MKELRSMSSSRTSYVGMGDRGHVVSKYDE